MVDLDVVVVGAGFSGIYAVHAFRSAGLTVRAFEAGDGIGGTWFWNSYPGARCDVESKDYSYSFSPELEQEWSWSERYPAQPEILRYLNHVADKFALWPHIQLNTRVTGAAWTPRRPRGASARRTASPSRRGSSSRPPAACPSSRCPTCRASRSLTGPGTTPHGGRRRASTSPASGSGSSAPGPRASRSPPRSPPSPSTSTSSSGRRTSRCRTGTGRGRRPRSARSSPATASTAPRRGSRSSGCRSPGPGGRSFDEPPQDVQRLFTERWEAGGGMPFLGAYTDVLVSQAANDVVAEFMRDRIREIVADPAVAELLCPRGYPSGPSGCARATTTTRCSTRRTCPWSTSGLRPSSPRTRAA